MMKRVLEVTILACLVLVANSVWASSNRCPQGYNPYISGGSTVCQRPPDSNGQCGDDTPMHSGAGQLMCVAGNASNSNGTCSRIASQYGQYRDMTNSQIVTALQNDPCIKASNVADQCCGNPSTCIGSTPSGDSDGSDSSIGGEVAQFVLATAVSIPGSIGAMCGRMQDAATVSTALIAYMTAKCQMKVQQCKSSCSSAAQQHQSDAQVVAECNIDTDTKQAVYTVASVYQQEISQCGSSNNADFAMAQQGVASVMATKFSTMCQQQAANYGMPTAAQNFNMPNCLIPAQAGTPFCQFQCDRPGAAANPTCAGLMASLQGPSGFTGSASGLGGTPNFGASGKSMFDDAPVADESAQQPNFGTPGSPGPQGLDKPEGGGPGSGLPGGGGAPMAGLGSAAGPQRGGGYDTSILRGVTAGGGYTGGGYSAHAGPTAMGGYPGADKGNVLSKLFHLKDYLPGGKNGEQRTAFRGLASTLADISPAHDDIFKKVTNRFYQVCLRDGLIDCDTLRKVSKPKN